MNERKGWVSSLIHIQAARVALAYHHFEKASNSVLLNCSRVLKKNQEGFATLQFSQEDQALVGHLMAIQEPLHTEEVIVKIDCFLYYIILFP